MGLVREALFNVCQNHIEGLFWARRMGAMGIKALRYSSRGAAQAVFVDASRESIRCITENLQHFALTDRSQVLQGDVFSKMHLLEKLKKSFDIIYVDPPYENCQEGLNYSKRVIELLDAGSLLKPGGLLFVEGPHPFDLQVEGLKSLTFEKARRMGRATLQQYSKRD